MRLLRSSVPQQFTFTAGNARKLAAIPLYALGRVATAVTPRRHDLWVLGSGSGIGEGALALHEYARDRGHELVWLTSSDRERADAAARGITAVPKNSWRGFTLTLRAGLIAVTHGFGDVNRFATHGAFTVQLWHGIPLKKIQLDAAVTFTGPLKRFLKLAYKRGAAQIDLLPAASALSAQRLRTAFGLPASRVVVTGDPRDDVLFGVSKSEARAALGLTGGQAVLYAPTWRDGDADPTVPSDAEWAAIEAWLAARDATLVVRPHPHGYGDYAAGVERCAHVRMMDSREVPDVTPLLPAFDALISDYSSIAFDFALTGGPIAFLAPDVAAYTRSRGLYEPYERFSGGTEVDSWGEVLALLEKPEPLTAHAAHLADTHHAYRDGANTARVYEQIITRMHGVEGKRMTSFLTVATGAPAQVSAAGISLSGEVGETAPTTVSLVGSRATTTAPVTVDGTRWSATVPLTLARWGGATLAAPSGSYQLQLDHGSVLLEPSQQLVPGLARVVIEGDIVTLAAPLTDDERGAANQARLEREYRSRAVTAADAVFFESFYGQNASCNPRAIDAEIARSHPTTRRYWSVVDASVAVPEGAIAIIEGSTEWWRVRAEARLLVVNDWLRKRYRKRAHQTVLQTWHGTMLKKIANDRPGQGIRASIASALEGRRWDVLLSQNAHSTAVFRTAYRYRGPIWEEGYPRDDALAVPLASDLRRRLGIPADKKVLLYAPTWRDDRLEHIDHLDVAAFTEAVGPDYVTLIRGHSRTLRPGRDVRASANVIDVTGYPDVTDLFLVADALVTDYSSVMFDFSVSGKPMFFFTPDLEHYREQLRGFYFDLLEAAPGPVTGDPAELARLITTTDPAEFGERYEAWQERFNPLDDGRAAARVVARLEGIGAL